MIKSSAVKSRLAYQKEYRTDNIGMMAQIVEWFETHPDYSKDYSRKYRQTHSRYWKGWAIKHPNYNKLRYKWRVDYFPRWRETNRERFNKYMRKYMRQYRKALKSPNC